MRVVLPFGWWSGGAVEGHLRRDWEAVGVTTFGELRAWARLAVCSPARVDSWRREGLGPIEARGFEERRIEPGEVAEWSAAVSCFEEFDSWSRIGVRDASTVRAWKSTTGGIAEVVAWQRMGATPDQVSHLQDAGVDPADRRQWLRIGISDVEVIARWTRAGFGPQSAKLWHAADVAPEGAAAWVSAGFDPRTSRRWRRTDWEPVHAAAWTQHGVKPSVATRWRAAGIPDADGPIWFAAGVSRQAAAEQQAAGQPPRARERPASWNSWLPRSDRHEAPTVSESPSTDGDAEMQAETITASTPTDESSPDAVATAPNAATVSIVADDSVVPEAGGDASSLTEPDGMDLERPRLDLAPLQDSAPQEPPPPPVTADPRVLEPDPPYDSSEPEEPAPSHDPVPTVPADWAAAGHDVRTWEQWRDDVEDAAQVAALIRAGLNVDALRAWRGGGFDDAGQIIKLHVAGIDPERARAWRTLGASRLNDILKWNGRWDPDQATRWSDATGGTLEVAWRWAAAVDAPGDARRWITLGFGTSAKAKRVIGVTGREAGSSLQLVESLVQAGVGSPGPVQRWLEASAVEEIERWVAIGVLDIGQAAAWSQAGIELGAAERWASMGVSVVEAAGWLDAGLEPDAAQPWCEALATPEEARRWLEADFDSAEAIVWLTAGVEHPERAAELASIGFSHLSFAEAANGKDAAEIHQVIRAQAISAAGLTLEAGLPTITFDESEDPEQALLTIARICTAAAASGEGRLKTVHGAPYLSLAAIRAIPDARYVRGQLKVRLFDALGSGELEALGAPLISPESSVEGTGEHDGGSTVLLLRPADVPDEYLRLPAHGAVSQ